MRIGLALKAFFASLFDSTKADRIRTALSPSKQPQPPTISPPTDFKQPSAPKKTTPGRSDALTLLSTLQREARLLDLVYEPLDSYSDAQIGAAARDVLRDSRTVLQRMFDLKPLVEDAEGKPIPIPDSASAVRWRVVGKQPQPGANVVIVHPGWQATFVQIPQWVGGPDDQLVLAPAEIEPE